MQALQACSQIASRGLSPLYSMVQLLRAMADILAMNHASHAMGACLNLAVWSYAMRAHARLLCSRAAYLPCLPQSDSCCEA